MRAQALPTPQEIVSYLDGFVRGQDQAKRDLARSVYAHYLAIAHRLVDPDDTIRDFGRAHVLLVGPSGSGKSYLVRLLAEMLGAPYCFLSATQLVQTGYTGTSIEGALSIVLSRAEHNLARAQRSIVFLDEVDKIRRHVRDDAGPDVSGEGVQNALLTVLDGQPVSIQSDAGRIRFDTSELLFICAGAFVDLPTLVARRLGTERGLGFRAAATTEEPSVEELLCSIETEDLVEFGLIPELVGRFGTLTHVSPLGVEDLVAILEETRASVVAKQRKLFSLHGIELEFTREALRTIAEDAVRLGTGARALERAVRKSLRGTDARLPELASVGIDRIVVTEGAVRGSEEPRMEQSQLFGGRVEADRLRWKVFRELDLKPKPLDTNRASADSLQAELGRLEDRIGWNRANPMAREWWRDYVGERGTQEAVALARAIASRRASLGDFHAAWTGADTQDWRAAVHFMEYLRLKRSAEDASPWQGRGQRRGA